MSFQFKPAIREQVGLLVGLAGGTGSGKTFSALRLAAGISGGKPFALIDTEASRGLHYADQFKFDHGDLKPPFSPQAYAEAILAADEAGYPVIVVDSCSHEWSGEGGVLEMQEAELDRMAGDDYAKRERVKMAAWIRPKMDHKKMVQRLLQVRAHLILCFRAEEKVEMIKDANGKMQIVPKVSMTGINGWIPVCEKNLPFELTASFLLTADAPGMPKPIKLQQQHKVMFPLDKPIDEESGRKVAAWASGGKVETYVDAALKEIDSAASLDTLKTLYGRAYTRAKKSGDVSDMTMLQNAYDKAKDTLTAPQEAAINSDEEPTI
jgi:AAA domain